MKILITSLVILTSVWVHAQNCSITLKGSIIDYHDNQPLEDAVVTIPSLNLSQYTDQEGKFSFKNICADAYDVMVTHHACEPITEFIELKEDQEVTWFLEHHIVQLENLEVEGYQHRDVATQPEIHLHQEEIERNSGETLGYLLKSVSGVSGLQTGSSIIKPMIHGMHSSRIIMMNRGVRQEDMEWGVEHSPNMDLNAFEDIRIIKGASALRYGGDAIGGVVISETPSLPKNDTLHGKIAVSGITNGKGGNINASIQKGFNIPLAFQVQASYKRHGDYKAPNYNLTNSGSEQKAFSTEITYGDFKQKLNLSYSYFETDLGILKASHLGNLSDLADAINASEPWVAEDFSYSIRKPYQNVQHHLAKIQAEKRVQNFGKIEAQYAFQINHRKEFDLRIGEVTDIPSMDVELTTHSAEVWLLLDKLDHLKIESGVDYNYQNNYTNPLTQVKRLVPDYDRIKAGGFITASYQPLSDLQFTGGIRYDYMRMETKKYFYKRYWDAMGYNTDFYNNIIGDYGNEWLTHFILDYNTISATLGTSYSPKNNLDFSLNYACVNRPPNPSELFSEGLHHSAVSIELGDVRLKPETAHKITFNYFHKLDLLEGLSINLLGHYSSIQDYIYQVPSGAEYTIRGAFPVWKYKQIDAAISGVDIDLSLEFNDYLSWGNKLSYIHATDKTNDLDLIQMPPLEWNQEIKYTSQSTLKPYLSLNTQWVAEQKRYADYNFNIQVLEEGVELTKLVDISTPPKGYFLINLSSGITTTILNNPLEINIKMQNIADTFYRNYLNRYRYYADEMGRQIQLQFIYKF